MPPTITPRSILADIDMDEELANVVSKFKDGAMTPEQLSLKIQGDRVIYILNRCLAKLNTLAYLPFLLENDAEIVRKYLKPSEAFFVLEVLTEWGLMFDTKDINNTEYIADYLRLGTVNKQLRKVQQPGTTLLPEGFPNPQIYQLVDILFYNKCIQSIIRTCQTTLIDKHAMYIIKLVQDLKEIAKTKVYVTGEEQTIRERELRKAYKSNILLNVVIAELKEQLDKQRKELGKQLEEKVKIYEMYKNKMETVYHNFKIDMRKTLNDSEKEMMQKSLESDEKQENLAEEAELTVQKYHDILRNNLEEEKKARAKRFKVETQLQNWINTFDQDIGEKQAQYDELKAEFDDKMDQKLAIEKLISEQEEEYNRSMQEKSDEEERIFNEMAYQFYLNRSARKIQKFWREYIGKRSQARSKKVKKVASKTTQKSRSRIAI